MLNLSDWDANRLVIQNETETFKEWFNVSRLSWDYLALNPNPMAIQILDAHPYMINWSMLSGNSEGLNLFKRYDNTEDYYYKLSSNTSLEAIACLKDNPDKIFWYLLSANPSAIEIIDQHLALYPRNHIANKIHWQMLCKNPKAMHILRENEDIIDWGFLSFNSGAIELLEANQEKINWAGLSSNPQAIHLLTENPDKIHLYYLCQNPNAEDLIVERMSQILKDPKCCDVLSANPLIFKSNDYVLK